MNIKVLLASVAGAITLFVLGYVIWGMLLASYFANNEIQYAGLSKQPPGLVAFFLSNLILAFLVAFESARTSLAGGVIGAVLGLMNKNAK